MNEDRLNNAVDRFVEELTLGGEPDDAGAARALEGDAALDFKDCVKAARWLEQTVVDASQDRLTQSGLPELASGVSFDPQKYGQALGDFEIIREAGRGGMGLVFEAYQKSLRRRVAIKVLPPGVSWHETASTRFAREAKAAAKLKHPHIIPVYSFSEAKGVSFFSMQFIDGITLSDLSKRYAAESAPPPKDGARAATAVAVWPIELPRPELPQYYHRIAEIMSDVADAVQYAHDHGVVHRDIKPSNVMLDQDGTSWVADFGLARMVDDVAVTRSGQMLGTLCYMSPEQAAGKGETDERSDVYGLGATLYELISLKPPFASLKPQALMRAIRDDAPAKPTDVNPNVPHALEAIALRAMEKSPERRYASAGAFREDLQRFLNSETTSAVLAARRSPSGGRWSGWMWPSAAAVLIVVLGAAVISWSFVGGARRNDVPTDPAPDANVPLDQFEQLLADGRGAFESGHLQEATETFRAAERERSTSAIPPLYLGLIALRDETREAKRRAGVHFAQARQLDPDSAILATLADATKVGLQGQQDWPQFRQNCVRLLRQSCDDAFAPDGLYALGQLLGYRDPPLAIRLLDSALNCRQDMAEAIAFRGRLRALSNDRDAAVADLEDAIRRRPDNAVYHVWLAWAYDALGRADDAGAMFDHAVEIDDSLLTRKERFIWRRLKKPEQDEAVMMPFVRRRGLSPEMQEEYRRICETPATTFADLLALGQVHRAAGKLADALSAFEQAIASLPAGQLGQQVGAAHLEVARLYADLGRDADAKSAYGKAISASPNLEFYLAYAGFCEERQRWQDLLAAMYDAAESRGLILDARARIAKAKAYLGTGSPALARGELQLAKEDLSRQGGGDPEIMDLIAQLETRAGQQF